jgi:hypothetical protein
MSTHHEPFHDPLSCCLDVPGGKCACTVLSRVRRWATDKAGELRWVGRGKRRRRQWLSYDLPPWGN